MFQLINDETNQIWELANVCCVVYSM